MRVPLGGRRVRGFVVGLREGDRTGLKSVQAVSGDFPVFTPKLLETLRWVALHYVAPLAVVLGKAAPPNLPRKRKLPAYEPVAERPLPAGLEQVGVGHSRTTVVVGGGPWWEIGAALAARVARAGKSTLVACPTFAEAEGLAAELRAVLGDRVVLGASALPAAETTKAWVQAASLPGTVVVGTREAAFWPVAEPGLAIVLGDGRRGLRDRQTPTTDTREVLRRRAAVERFGLVLLGAVPTAAAMAAGPEVVRIGARPWPLVEVVDRSAEPPSAGFVTGQARRALRATVEAGREAFVFTRARGYAPAFRCESCRALRRCGGCGARGGRAAACERCGAVLGPCPECGGQRFEPLGAGVGRVVDELRRLLDPDAVGDAAAAAPVRVGTERDLVGLGPVDLAVVVDADGLLLAPHYRAAEDALRVMARVALAVRRGRGRRCIVQTSTPEAPAIAALRRGDPLEFLDGVLAERAAERFPPAGELLVLETEGEPPTAGERLAALGGGGATVLGPADVRGRRRWLVQGPDLRTVRVGLRGLVQDWRDGGTRVRVDVDPLDL